MSKEYVAEMLEHYLIAVLWAETDNTRDSGGDPLDKNYCASDFAPEALKQAKEDCAKFYLDNATLLEGIDAEQAGHDFWLTRRGHGAGFWDRGLGERGEKLTKACKKFEDVHAIVGDDNKIYFE